MTDRRRLLAPAAACALLIAVSSGAAGSVPRAVHGGRHVGAVAGAPAHRTTWHYAANHNFGPRGRYLLRRFGFTLADVSSPSTVRLLPPGVKALVYVGLCGGNTRHFRSVTTRFRPAWRVFGFYLMDVPDQRSCRPRHLAAESRFIHRRFAHAVTFIELENVSSSRHPRFGAYTTPHTGIDLFGVAPYPCRSELHGCDLAMIKQYVQAARRDGIARRQIVPVFQAFGGGRWRDDGGGRYLLPTARQAHAIVCRWHRLVPHPVFDYAYSWGVQRHDAALVTAPARLRRVFVANNGDRLRC